MKWDLIESDLVLSDNWIKVRRDKCRMPDGKIVDPYYVLERPDYCVIFPITTDRKVVLVRQYRQGAGVVSLELPGGLFEPGESDPESVARRELVEETGYGKGKFRLIGTLFPNPAVQNNTAYCYLAEDVTITGEQNLDHNEDIEILLTPIEQLQEMLTRTEIKHAIHLGVMLMALNELKTRE
ncbi:MAG: NUDIX hydrolase [bacterium]|nr:NUDIX hydrolase [bacterium]